jgi:hypothetical protein
MKSGYNNKLIPSVPSTKFLWFVIDSTLTWGVHIDNLTTKLSTACYVIRSFNPLMSHKTVLSFYHSCIHTVMSYRIILWGNSCHRTHIFQIKKRVSWIIMGCGTRDSRRILFKKLIILPLTSQYILSLLIFGVNNKEQFLINSEIHNKNMRHSSNLHLHSANLDIYEIITIQVLRFLILFLSTLKYVLIIRGY